MAGRPLWVLPFSWSRHHQASCPVPLRTLGSAFCCFYDLAAERVDAVVPGRSVTPLFFFKNGPTHDFVVQVQRKVALPSLPVSGMGTLAYPQIAAGGIRTLISLTSVLCQLHYFGFAVNYPVQLCWTFCQV